MTHLPRTWETCCHERHAACVKGRPLFQQAAGPKQFTFHQAKAAGARQRNVPILAGAASGPD